MEKAPLYHIVDEKKNEPSWENRLSIKF
jgi:hypothetical protein